VEPSLIKPGGVMNVVFRNGSVDNVEPAAAPAVVAVAESDGESEGDGGVPGAMEHDGLDSDDDPDPEVIRFAEWSAALPAKHSAIVHVLHCNRGSNSLRACMHAQLERHFLSAQQLTLLCAAAQSCLSDRCSVGAWERSSRRRKTSDVMATMPQCGTRTATCWLNDAGTVRYSTTAAAPMVAGPSSLSMNMSATLRRCRMITRADV